jgi:glycosyltransferase involved in cell wall biosynthesis
MKVFMAPRASTAASDNGIGRIIHAMERLLPAYGISFTDDQGGADIRVFHAGTATPNDKIVDVLINHGLYWQDLQHQQFSRSNNVANQRIIDAARRAKIITVPSDWVAEPFRRDMRIEPEIVGHGIDVGEWNAGQQHGGYILWNKNRPTDVCDPSPAWRLAEKELKVVSTFGPVGKLISSLHVIGQIPFDRMKSYIEHAEIYLATAPETFGIGTLEAMICGCPVLGYDWCGTKDLVKHKETGYLVAPGDIQGLYEGAIWLRSHRAEIGANAREFAKGFDWPAIMARYYALFQRAAQPDPTGVSVVISNYNYGNWVGDAIHSCEWQQRRPDEIIVVDDGSTDDSLVKLREFEAKGKIRLIAQTNQGVAAARNNGIAAARFPFIVSLDADDMIGPEYIQALAPALERDRGLGVAYCGVRFMDLNGKDTGFSAYKPFSWEIQAKAETPPPTCIPSGSMFRKEMWKRNGGYKQKYAPGEDTEFWTHGLSLGFTAELITPETMFWYRGHEGSASRTRKYVKIDDNKPWLHDKIYPMAAPAFYVPAVRSYLNPVVSVIIPVGPGHEKLVIDAVESIIGQSIREWEIVLIDDTGGSLETAHSLDRFPFLHTFRTKGKQGAGYSRNLGIEKAKGKFVLFLDADDWLRPDSLDLMLQVHIQTGHYVFTNHVEVHKDGRQFNLEIQSYDRDHYRDSLTMHAVTALVPTEWARAVGGFDPELVGWEEFDFFMKMAVKGYCGVLLRQNLLYYRVDTGERRKQSFKNEQALLDLFKVRYGGVEMAGCCGSGGSAILEAKRAIGLLPRETITVADLPNEVRLEFTGQWMGPVAFQANGRTYYGAKDDLHRFINAPREDVEKLVSTGKWRVIQPPAEARIRDVQPEPAQPVQQQPIIRQG